MTDVHSIGTRSYNMSRIRSKDTKPEIVVRRFLHANGFRYSLHDKKLPGKPDILEEKHTFDEM
jgi:DNA mismatch endonuclease, patch repair protein